MCEQVLRVKTLRMKGFASPGQTSARSKQTARGRTLTGDHAGNLDDGVDFGLGEDALAPGALDVETENAERSDGGPVAVGCMGDECIVSTGLVSAKDSPRALHALAVDLDLAI